MSSLGYAAHDFYRRLIRVALLWQPNKQRFFIHRKTATCVATLNRELAQARTAAVSQHYIIIII